MGGGATAASAGGGDDEEQKSARLREDLAAADGDGGGTRKETAPARALTEVSVEGEDGSRRAQEADAILAAASIPEARVGAVGASAAVLRRRERSGSKWRGEIFYRMGREGRGGKDGPQRTQQHTTQGPTGPQFFFSCFRWKLLVIKQTIIVIKEHFIAYGIVLHS